jgi:hypothetical protein
VFTTGIYENVSSLCEVLNNKGKKKKRKKKSASSNDNPTDDTSVGYATLGAS